MRGAGTDWIFSRKVMRACGGGGARTGDRVELLGDARR